jgi:4-hydroxythreonine-4-phosphate dehydrogenase
VRDACAPVIIADARALLQQAALLSLPCDFTVVRQIPDIIDSNQALLLDTGDMTSETEWGKLSAASGLSSIRWIETCARLCLDGRLDAMATAPINKEAIKMAGSPFTGHTDMLASLCGVDDSLMCFFAGDLRVALLTVHTSLMDAIKAVTHKRVADTLTLFDSELKRFGLVRPRIAVAGLNPHAGEHGLFGREEEREIAPAIEECRARRGIDVAGPFPSDTLFMRAWRGEFDAVLACYHDQGLIAVKCLAFGKAVNVTLGLPIIRTSVDHGTAFDIAGRGVAEASSMTEAIMLAAKLVREQSI